MLVSDLMSAPVRGAQPHDTVSHARNLMIRHRISRVLIIDEGRALGIITKKDIGFSLRRNDPPWRYRDKDNVLLMKVMSKDLVVISPDSSARDALLMMVTHKISGVPVIDQGMVLGIITRTDLLESRLVKELNAPVQDLMHDPVVITKKHSAVHAVDLIRKGACAVVVVDESGPAGIISDTDLAFYEEPSDLSGLVTAADVMRPFVPVLSETAKTTDAVELMQKNNCQCVIIADENCIKGIITRDDIIREVAQ